MAKVSMPLYLEEKTKDELKILAESQKRSMSATVEVLIIEAVKQFAKNEAAMTLNRIIAGAKNV
jgi:hypothetical protein